jgi:hypothetical protein
VKADAPAPVLNAELPYGELGLKGDMPPLRALFPKPCCDENALGKWLDCEE